MPHSSLQQRQPSLLLLPQIYFSVHFRFNPIIDRTGLLLTPQPALPYSATGVDGTISIAFTVAAYSQTHPSAMALLPRAILLLLLLSLSLSIMLSASASDSVQQEEEEEFWEELLLKPLPDRKVLSHFHFQSEAPLSDSFARHHHLFPKSISQLVRLHFFLSFPCCIFF